MSTEFPVTITPAARAQMVAYVQRKSPESTFIRIGVKGGGCTGLEYVMRPEASARETDLQLPIDGLTVLCDPKSAEFLAGSTLDYSGNLMGGQFKFDNPNAERSCGCGTSFSPKRVS